MNRKILFALVIIHLLMLSGCSAHRSYVQGVAETRVDATILGPHAYAVLKVEARVDF